jgi:uncharacterized phiE125 gp8 family phage protein
MRHYGLTLITPPASEPVSIEDAVSQLRVVDETEYGGLERMIRSARERVETDSQRKLLTQTWDITFDGPPCEGERDWVLPLSPIQSVTSITIYDTEDTASTWASTNYALDASSDRIYLKSGACWPTGLRCAASVVIRVVVGYGALPSAAPSGLVEAVLQMTAHHFEERQIVQGGPGSNVQTVPLGYDALIANYWRGLVTI